MPNNQIISSIKIDSATDDNKVPTYDAATDSLVMETPAGGGAGYVLYGMNNVALSPADSTTYFLGTNISSIPTTSAGGCRIYIPKAGNVTAIYGTIMVGGTLSSGEDSTIAFRLNNTTDTTVTTTVETNAAVNYYNGTGLSIAVVAGDYFELKFTTPAFTTNPTNLRFTHWIYIE